ncbi:uncharacterized protein LOC6535130 [Drosophila yakuba]|uniref:uncharacterized protein LOC6535130 n=1 Tax=Drosophila yakuba TaxID=7245 RepID=UPI001C8A1279|nr:uncharacterized protein LOC6535130 [Drosophila yakuba]
MRAHYPPPNRYIRRTTDLRRAFSSASVWRKDLQEELAETDQRPRISGSGGTRGRVTRRLLSCHLGSPASIRIHRGAVRPWERDKTPRANQPSSRLEDCSHPEAIEHIAYLRIKTQLLYNSPVFASGTQVGFSPANANIECRVMV